MKIEKIVLGIINENCYLLLSDKAAVVIDAGYYAPEITDFLKQNEDKERLVLITHAHFDHIGGIGKIVDETGVKVGICEKECEVLSDDALNLSARFRLKLSHFKADYKFKDGNIITVGDLKIKVIETPGHTKGSVCYLVGDNLFSGDMLFFESYGRTDFPMGNMEEIKQSYYKLITTLDENTKVFPGHGEATTIAHEIENNPLGYISAL